MVWLIDDWIRRLSVTSIRQYVSNPNGIWKLFSQTVFIKLGEWNDWLLLCGPRHQGQDPLSRKQQSTEGIEGNLPFMSASTHQKELAEQRKQQNQAGTILPEVCTHAFGQCFPHNHTCSRDV